MKQVFLAWMIFIAAGIICLCLKVQNEPCLPAISELPNCRLRSAGYQSPVADKGLMQVLALVEVGRIADGRELLNQFTMQHPKLSSEDQLFSDALAQTIQCLLPTPSSPTVIMPQAIFSRLNLNQNYCLRRTIVVALLRQEQNLAAVEQAACLDAALDHELPPDSKAKRDAQYLLAYALARSGQMNLSRSFCRPGLEAAQKAGDTSEIELWKQLNIYLDSHQ